MPSRRTRSTVRRSIETENFAKPPRSLSRQAPTDDDIYSRETLARKQDQRIKDDITNTLYRIEMDRVKPGLDVQLKTSNFRTNVRPKRRHFTPEPGVEIVPAIRQVVDLRRYSTAGNLDIYRPKTQRIEYSYDRPVSDALSHVDVIKSTTSPTLYWKSPSVARESVVSGPLSDYEIRKLAELRVRGRSNGPRLPSTTNGVPYLPLTVYTHRSSTPSDVYRTTVEKEVNPRSNPPGVSSVGRKLNDSQYELDQFENLMKRTFGSGGVNRSKTLLYTAPAYNNPYEYVRLSPTTSYTYATLPRSSRTYYAERPYYRSDYAYPYYHSPYPYYASSYYPYSYYSERPKEYDYGLYSPPTRVTPPGNYHGYYDTGYYGYNYLPSRYAYSYVV